MNRNRKKIKTDRLVLIFLAGLLFICGCQQRTADLVNPSNPHPLIELRLTGELSEPQSEISGLCWYKDQLLLLPQYPGNYKQNTKSALFRIPKQAITVYLERIGSGQLQPLKIELDDQATTALIPGFQGYEAIVCFNDRVFLIIESNQAGNMLSYLVQGQVSEDYTKIVLDPDNIKVLDLPRQIRNMSFETLLIAEKKLIAIYELNGANVNASPFAVTIDPKTGLTGAVSFPTIEYRVTDATAVDEKGNFWVLNYYWPGEYQLVKPAQDLPFAKIDKIPIFKKEQAVERLIQLNYSADGIRLTDTAPIYLGSENKVNGRNWEGVVRLGERGFLIVTDKHPRTILAFVASDSVVKNTAIY